MGDDQPERGEAVARALAQAGVEVHAVATTYGDAVDACLTHKPAVTVLAADWPPAKAVIAFADTVVPSDVVLYAADPQPDALPPRVWAVVPAGATDGELVAAVWSTRRGGVGLTDTRSDAALAP